MLEITNEDEEFKYFGEFSRKLRVKECKHTMKSRPYKNMNDTTIVRATHTPSSNNYSKLQEIAVTDIDNYFDYGFTKGSKRTFNTPERWEELEEILQENAIKISSEYNRYEGHCKIHYDIPIVGHMLYPNTYMNTKKQKIQDNWLLWNGKYYNPDYIYSTGRFPIHYSYGNYQGGTLKKLCPLIQYGKDPLTILGKINDKYNRIATTSFTKQNKDYIQIDLGQITELNYIGTLGGYPTKITPYPNHCEYSIDYSNKRRRRKRKRNKFVYVIEDENELCWVKRYKLEYRDLYTGKWIIYESSLIGNEDISTENIHKISLIARYLRITPLDYCNQRRMRVNIYGDGVRKELKEGDLEVETVRYTVSPPSSHKMLDGYGNGRYYNGAPIESKKITMFKMLRDEVQSYYDRPSRCGWAILRLRTTKPTSC